MVFGLAGGLFSQQASDVVSELKFDEIESFVENNCLECHSESEAAGQLNLEALQFSDRAVEHDSFDTAAWESMLRRIAGRQMPPPDASRPDESEYKQIVKAISDVLERRAVSKPKIGRVGTLRRLTRTEYQNAIRDLLGVQIDAAEFLPQDESSHGFDNITVEELTPSSLSQYITAAQKISRASIGGGGNGPVGVTIRVPADRTQEQHVEGLPLGTRGGILLNHHFPQTGQYEIELKLARDRDEKIEGLNRKHNIDVLLDKARIHRFTVAPPKGGKDFTHADSHLNTRIKVEAGTRALGITFPKISSALIENKREPFDATYNRHRHPRQTPALYQVSIVGPFDSEGPGKTVCRQSIFAGLDPVEDSGRDRAIEIVSRLARRAFRRPINEDDLVTPMKFFDEGFEEAGGGAKGFEQGVQSAITSLLVNPNFLFRIETQIPDGKVNPLTSVEVASRLSFFLWSSIPDDELLELAEQDRLQDEAVLQKQVKRMLADPKSKSLVNNFASQWLYLRNLDSITPDLRRFPDFDDNLRQAFRQETELLFNDILRNDRSVLNLIQSDYTYLNARLAHHYEIPNVSGSEFRRVDLASDSLRGGILRHGSILMVTSYATRTSPTIRGNWVLENLVGTPAPPPPPDVPNLKENTTLDISSVRERLALHRENPNCASCHDRIDPIGFSLENFDAVGRWREIEDVLKVDSQGVLPDGTEINSIDELERGILKRPEEFVQTMSEKLMTFALGRAMEPEDGPAVRRIVQNAKQDEFRFSAVITGIVLSRPFRNRGPAAEVDAKN